MFQYERFGSVWRTTAEYAIMTDCTPRLAIIDDMYSLAPDGLLIIRKGYAWDGATCAIDTKDFMRGSCVHDAICQMVETGKLDHSNRKKADILLGRIIKEDGMPFFRRWWAYAAVRLYGRGKYGS